MGNDDKDHGQMENMNFIEKGMKGKEGVSQVRRIWGVVEGIQV